MHPEATTIQTNTSSAMAVGAKITRTNHAHRAATVIILLDALLVVVALFLVIKIVQRMIRNRRLYRYSLDALQQEADIEEDHNDLAFGKRRPIQSPSCTQPQSQAQQRTQPSSRSPNPCQRSPLQSTTKPQPQQGHRQVQGHGQGQGQNRYAPNDMHYRRGPQKSQPITLEISERPVSGTQHSVIKYREVSPMSLPRARHPIVGQPESQGLVGSDTRCGRRQILMPESYHNYKINLGDLNKRVVYC